MMRPDWENSPLSINNPVLQLELSHIAKSFNRRYIFSDISVTLGDASSLSVTGKNGSGKSTLLKIIAGILRPSKGTVTVLVDGKNALNNLYPFLGFVSPYLQLYDEFTGLENLELVQEIRGLNTPPDVVLGILARVGLKGRENDLLRTYSSGMKQRLKYAAALIHSPKILLLDEPTSNLDQEGKHLVKEIAAEQLQRGILIIATNEKDEVGLCRQTLELGAPLSQ